MEHHGPAHGLIPIDGKVLVVGDEPIESADDVAIGTVVAAGGRVERGGKYLMPPCAPGKRAVFLTRGALDMTLFGVSYLLVDFEDIRLVVHR